MDHAFALDDTIAALASAPGPADRGIIRLSGGDVRTLLSGVFEPDDPARWESSHCAWRHPGVIPLPDLNVPFRVDVLLWPSTRSYTGEPLAEIHTLGSPPVLEAVLAALFERGVRPANRGEFTLRAFLAGRIDLLQAEAVLGVIDATDQGELNVALKQLGGGLSHQVAALHEELLLYLADLEAGLDFVEEDIEFVSHQELQRRLMDGIRFLDQLSAQANARLQSTGRRRVVLAGLPNAGKSTLFNALAGGDHAIISPAPGTTRDYLSVVVDGGGLAFELIDTAGWDERAIGVAGHADGMRQQQWEHADLIVWCSPADLPAGAAAEDKRQRNAAGRIGRPVLHITTKSDCRTGDCDHTAVLVSAVKGEGLAVLRQSISALLRAGAAETTLLGSTSARCRDSLNGALAALERARDASDSGAGDELLAVELRESIDHLGKIAGRVSTDDLLDRIFSRFCIGK